MTDPAPARAGMPRWVKVFVVGGVAVALVVLLALVFGGGHGPGRHMRHGRGAVPVSG